MDAKDCESGANKSTFSYLNDLPKELLPKIFMQRDLAEQDRQVLSLVSKKFNFAFRDPNLSYMFHIQGNTVKLLETGLKTLSVTKYRKYETLKISKFFLPTLFDDNFNSGQLFGRAIARYVNPAIKELIIYECTVTEVSLRRLFQLYPGVTSLTLYRCPLTLKSPRHLRGSNTSQGDHNEVPDERIDEVPMECEAHSSEGVEFSRKPLTKLTVTNPIYSNLDIDTLYDLIHAYCAEGFEKVVEDSFISPKRSVLRRFSRYVSNATREINARDLLNVAAD